MTASDADRRFHDLRLCCFQTLDVGRPVKLYVGNAVAAGSAEALFEHDITATLNTAVNIDMAPLTLPDRTEVIRAKVGLIDGSGNAPEHMLAAALTVQGMIQQQCPGKPSYPIHRSGNILVHCRGGSSRSVATCALYLVLFHRDRYPGIFHAVSYLRSLIGLDQTNFNAEMIRLCEAAWLISNRPFIRTG